MEDAFRFAVLALFEANQSLCAENPRLGRFAQHTVLDMPAVFERHGFPRQVLKRTRDPVIRHWFEGYFEALDRLPDTQVSKGVTIYDSIGCQSVGLLDDESAALRLAEVRTGRATLAHHDRSEPCWR